MSSVAVAVQTQSQVAPLKHLQQQQQQQQEVSARAQKILQDYAQPHPLFQSVCRPLSVV